MIDLLWQIFSNLFLCVLLIFVKKLFLISTILRPCCMSRYIKFFCPWKTRRTMVRYNYGNSQRGCVTNEIFRIFGSINWCKCYFTSLALDFAANRAHSTIAVLPLGLVHRVQGNHFFVSSSVFFFSTSYSQYHTIINRSLILFSSFLRLHCVTRMIKGEFLGSTNSVNNFWPDDARGSEIFLLRR